MPGLGSFALAGAVGGAGEALVQQAEQRRKERLVELRTRRTSGSGGGGSNKDDEFEVSNSELIRMKDIYSDVFGGPGGLGSRSAPNLGAFQQEVMRLMRENPNLDVVTASNRAADAWQSETVTVEADTKLLSPKTWDGEVEEEEFDFRYDTAPTPPDTPEPPEDDSSTGAPAPKPPESPEDPATPKPPKESTNPVSEMKKDPDGNPIVETKEQYDALPVGTTFIAPDGSKRTKK